MRGLILGSLLLLGGGAGQIVNPSGGGAPTGACGGDLGGTYPNCTVVGSHIVSGGAALTAVSSVTAATATSSGAPTLAVFDTETGGGYMVAQTLRTANMGAGNRTAMVMGKDSGTNNEVYTTFQYNGNNSATNQWCIQFASVAISLCTTPTGMLNTQAMQGISAVGLSVGAGTATLASGSSNLAGAVNSTVSGTLTFTLTWAVATYSHRAVCRFENETTPANVILTTSANGGTLTASGTTISGDVITYSCPAGY